MAKTNEILIQKVFQEMMKYKPLLQKMLVTDEEEEETLDPRLQGDIIIRNFPWHNKGEKRRYWPMVFRPFK
jgi:hypothetical protein